MTSAGNNVRIERERQEAEAELIARQEASAALAESNRKARLEREERISREVRDREIRDLRYQSARQQAWQDDVQRAVRKTIADRQRQAVLADLHNHFSPPPEPPPPPPGPEVVYVVKTRRRPWGAT